eukprot:CAMPEP_0204900028 /NCGR_PEP_ID=MMETSP1397-20131031/2212_1 /ASSEMBLY_ACC=CAM_ASM_000891 /TAXON_ID=49980 /ORGANISM="Climacostomum Climacostomum virens, Strain Stock W-24" /LENGTH=333 /DNA_ID=CAMNT_0052068085 /DNA_START=94 /DNA_END=1091 /DNA_ORIENTATION=+
MTQDQFTSLVAKLTGLTPEQTRHIFSQTNRNIVLRDISDAYGVDHESLRLVWPDWDDDIEVMRKMCRRRGQPLLNILEKTGLGLSELIETMFLHKSTLEGFSCEIVKSRKLRKLQEELETPPHAQIMSELPSSKRVYLCKYREIVTTCIVTGKSSVLNCKCIKRNEKVIAVSHGSLFCIGYGGEVHKFDLLKDFAKISLSFTCSRVQLLCAVCFKGFVYAFCNFHFSYCERYNLREDSWEVLQDLPFALYESTAVARELTNSIYVFGGTYLGVMNQHVLVFDVGRLRWGLCPVTLNLLKDRHISCFTLKDSPHLIFFIDNCRVMKFDILKETA